jgi:hypothetical protein
MEGIDLKEAYGVLARKLEIVLRSQAPSEKIASRISVDYDSEGMYINTSPSYGTFLLRGTEEERSPASIDTGMNVTQELLDALSGYAPDPRPGHGRGGIKPRYFLSFTDTVNEMIADDLSTAYAEAIEEMIVEEFTNNL